MDTIDVVVSHSKGRRTVTVPTPFHGQLRRTRALGLVLRALLMAGGSFTARVDHRDSPTVLSVEIGDRTLEIPVGTSLTAENAVWIADNFPSPESVCRAAME